MKICSGCGGQVEQIYWKYGRKCRACRDVIAKRNRDLRPEIHRSAGKRYRTANIERVRNRTRLYLWRKQGMDMTIERYGEMLAEQGGRCAICRTDKPPRKRASLFVDHDHGFGHVRGLLCGRCNSAIAFLDDSPGKLRAAINYLKKHQPKLKLERSA